MVRQVHVLGPFAVLALHVSGAYAFTAKPSCAVTKCRRCMANQRHSTAKRASAATPLRQRPVGIYTTDEEPSLDNARDDFHPEEDTGLGGEDRRQGEKTFARWLEVETWRRPEISDMSSIMMAVESACKTLSALVKRAQTDDLAGMYHGGDSGGVNIQGEAQKKLDVVSNRIMVAQLCSPGGLSCVASEEEEYPQMCSTVVGHSAFTGEYAAVFDPLDGSANIGAGLPCGTIFGILKRPPGGKVGPRTVMQSGKRLLAAGYCLYGGQTNLVLTLGNGVQQFTLDPKRGEFVLTEPNMRIPIRGSLYSANEANSHAWDGRIQDYVNDLKTGRGPSGQQYQSRYNGALIADIHNILHYGGIFLYPADNKNPNGKLRLLYEGNPIGMIVEQAGGAASTGFQRILDVPPLNTHHRIPTFFGSPEDVYDLCAYLKRPL